MMITERPIQTFSLGRPHAMMVHADHLVGLARVFRGG